MMGRWGWRIAAVAALVAVLGVGGPLVRAAGPAGKLVVIGGGGVPDAVLKRTLEMAGGPVAKVVVFPQASELAETGDVNVKMWKDAGATDVRWLPVTDLPAARKAVEVATLVWFPGGDQAKLTAALLGTGLPELIQKRYEAGAIVAGTSAGAAVMSSIMLTGDADLQSVTVGATKTIPGFGFWPGVIVDQHFLKRQREARLISLVLDHPDLIAVGIDEKTAVIVSGRRFEVVGQSTVLVFDARKTAVEKRAVGQLSAARGITMHVLTAWMTFEY